MNRAKKTAYLGLSLALCLIFSYLESLLPFQFGIVGFRIGLPNFLILLLLSTLGFGAAISVNILRILIVNLLFGNIISLAFSLAAGVLSTLLMFALLKLRSIGFLGASAAGGACHNVVQTVVAALLFQNAALLKLCPPLMLLGLFTGIFCGIISYLCNRRMEKLGIQTKAGNRGKNRGKI